MDSMDSSSVVSSSSATVMFGSSRGDRLACLPGESSFLPSSEFACLPIPLCSRSESESESEELEDEVEEAESELDSERLGPWLPVASGGGLRSYSSRNSCSSLQVSVGESGERYRKYSCIVLVVHGCRL